MMDFYWFSGYCRCSGGSRVLQHCVTCEAGEGENTRQWEQNVSGMWENNSWRNRTLCGSFNPINQQICFYHHWHYSKEVFHSSTLSLCQKEKVLLIIGMWIASWIEEWFWTQQQRALHSAFLIPNYLGTEGNFIW